MALSQVAVLCGSARTSRPPQHSIDMSDFASEIAITSAFTVAIAILLYFMLSR
jgi:hypothetical protein